MPQELTKEERVQSAMEQGIVVDQEDQWLLGSYTWNVWGQYVSAKIQRNPVKAALLHHCIVGQPLNGWVIDHVDRNPLNNTRDNLRYVSRSQNHLNSVRSDQAQHIAETRAGTYQVSIRRNGVQHYLGTYATIDVAEKVRDEWLEKREM